MRSCKPTTKGHQALRREELIGHRASYPGTTAAQRKAPWRSHSRQGATIPIARHSKAVATRGRRTAMLAVEGAAERERQTRHSEGRYCQRRRIPVSKYGRSLLARSKTPAAWLAGAPRRESAPARGQLCRVARARRCATWSCIGPAGAHRKSPPTPCSARSRRGRGMSVGIPCALIVQYARSNRDELLLSVSAFPPDAWLPGLELLFGCRIFPDKRCSSPRRTRLHVSYRLHGATKFKRPLDMRERFPDAPLPVITLSPCRRFVL